MAVAVGVGATEGGAVGRGVTIGMVADVSTRGTVACPVVAPSMMAGTPDSLSQTVAPSTTAPTTT